MPTTLKLQKKDDSLTIKQGFEKFIALRKIMNVSTDTIRGYSDCYRYFEKFLGAEFLCKDIDEELIFDYIQHLQENHNANERTINSYLVSIRTYINYLIHNGVTPKFKVPMIRAEKRIKEIYTEAELERLLKKPDVHKCSWEEYRNWVMTAYFLGTANRVSTVANLRIGDINFSANEIMLKTVKNKRQSIIPLSPSLKRILLEYLEYRESDNESDFLFVTRFGEPLNRSGMQTALRRYNQSRGISKTSPHLYRNTFAKTWLLNKGDIVRLQKILCHSSLEMVKEYAQMYGSDLQKDFELFNPLDNMQGIKRTVGNAISMKKNK